MGDSEFTVVGEEQTIVKKNDANYKNICGRNDTESTGVVDKFSKEIGCVDTHFGNNNSLKFRQATRKAQFRKAKDCFSRRLTRMGTYNASNDKSSLKRETHAHAVRVAYAFTKDCLEKTGLPTDKFRNSANQLLTEINTAKPGVRKAVTGKDSGRTINNAVSENDVLMNRLKPVEVEEVNFGNNGLSAEAVAAVEAGAEAAAGAGAGAGAEAGAGAGAGAKPAPTKAAAASVKNRKKANTSKKAKKNEVFDTNLLKPEVVYDISAVKPIAFKDISKYFKFFAFLDLKKVLPAMKSDDDIITKLLIPLCFVHAGILIRFLKTDKASLKAATMKPTKKYPEKELSVLNFLFDHELGILKDEFVAIFNKFQDFKDYFKDEKPNITKVLEFYGTDMFLKIKKRFETDRKISWHDFFPQLAKDDLDPQIEEFL